MGQTSPAPTRAGEGKMPVGEAHSRPPDFANPSAQGPIVWEPGSVDPKAYVRAHQARRPVLNEGARMRPNPWPNSGTINALHASPSCHTPATLGAPDEEEDYLRTIPSRGEHVAERPSRTLLERIRGTRAREDRRPSPDVDAQTPPSVEQDAQAAPAPLLEGEEKRTPSVSSEQAAAPGTPSTSNTHYPPYPATPADSEATPQPRTRIRTRAHNPSRIAHDIQTGRVVYPGTSPPSPSSSHHSQAHAPDIPSAPLRRSTRICMPSRIIRELQAGEGASYSGTNAPQPAPNLQAPVALAEDSEESGGVWTVEEGTPALLEDSEGMEFVFATEMADAEALEPCTLAEALHSHIAAGVHRRLTPPLSTDQVPDARGYPITRMARPVVQGAERAASTTSTPMRWPVSQQTAGSLTRRPPCGPLEHPFGTRSIRFTRTKTNSPLEGNPAAAGSMARNWRAKLGRAFPFDSGTTTPLIFHW